VFLCFLYWVCGRKHKNRKWYCFIFESLGFHSGVAKVAVLLDDDSSILSILIRCSDAIAIRSRNFIMIIRKRQFTNLSSTCPRNTPHSTKIEGSLPLSEKIHFHPYLG
jgi:hypothetical protein